MGCWLVCKLNLYKQRRQIHCVMVITGFESWMVKPLQLIGPFSVLYCVLTIHYNLPNNERYYIHIEPHAIYVTLLKYRFLSLMTRTTVMIMNKRSSSSSTEGNPMAIPSSTCWSLPVLLSVLSPAGEDSTLEPPLDWDWTAVTVFVMVEVTVMVGPVSVEVTVL